MVHFHQLSTFKIPDAYRGMGLRDRGAVMLRQNVTIIETPQGFLWTQQGKYYKTLAAVRRAVECDAKVIAKSPAANGAVATLFEVY